MKNSKIIAVFFLFLMAFAVSGYGLAGCTTVHQAPVANGHAPAAIEAEDGSVTLHQADLDEYNGLIEVYGNHKLANGAPVFVPALRKNDGVTAISPGLYRLDPPHVIIKGKLAGMKLRGAKP